MNIYLKLCGILCSIFIYSPKQRTICKPLANDAVREKQANVLIEEDVATVQDVASAAGPVIEERFLTFNPSWKKELHFNAMLV